MKVAVAIWNNRVSPVFDVSRQILILDIQDGEIRGRCADTFVRDEPAYRVSKLRELNIETLICGAVSAPLSNMLNASGIQTIAFVAGEVEEVIRTWLADSLPNPAMTMPGCCGMSRQAGICQKPLTGKEEGMPHRDGTGPEGKGPTGRGLGPCRNQNGQQTSGQNKPQKGQGQGPPGGQKRSGGWKFWQKQNQSGNS